MIGPQNASPPVARLSIMYADPLQVLARYALPPGPPRPFPCEGGFSGANVWQVETPAGKLCLRAWPPGRPDEQRIRFIHGLIEHVFDRSVRIVPRPLRTATGETFVEHRGRLWELAPWLPGHADFSPQIAPARLAAALQTLARFHVAAASMPVEQATGGGVSPSPGILDRRDQLARWRAGELDALRRRLTTSDWPELHTRALRIVELFVRAEAPVRAVLDDAACKLVPLQPVLKDVWRAHVLFAGVPEVTGLIDFGSAAIDTVAADIARLLGSYCGDDASGWQTGLAAYESVRPLSPAERALIDTFDVSTVLMGGLVWLRWYYVEDRRFPRPEEVLRRLDGIIRRLVCLVTRGIGPSETRVSHLR